jgi:tetratricopeptide (TPR) repeat protein
MKRFPLALSLLLISLPVVAQHRHALPDNTRPVTLMQGLGENHHPVSTGNAEAQRFFDQGLLLVYGFNHAEAVRSFKRALELDPRLAMAHWGIALALGPNINAHIDAEGEKAAYDEVQKALSLSSGAPESERAYIRALAKRYSIAPGADLKKLAVDYRDAMRELASAYPDDLDAATLYAESAMDLRPWKLWTGDGKPAEGTEEIILVLESVLRRNPNHIGANHYYIHAVEASPQPERALPSADRLRAQVKAAGHLVHMPAHIYMRTGDYELAARSNEDAAAADRAYFDSTGMKGMYAAGYYSHNLHFLAIAYSMSGRFKDAQRAANQLAANVGPFLKDAPPLESFLIAQPLILVRFGRWDDILKAPASDSRLHSANTIWRWARAMAHAARGQIAEAETERTAFVEAQKSIPAGAEWGLNSVGNILKIAQNLLDAKIAAAKHEEQAVLSSLRKAVEAEDALAYDEPPAWFVPPREALGGALLMSGKAAEAERVFRADLEKNPRSGRSLFGLLESLKAQGKTYPAQFVQREFETAWKNADTQLKLEDL